MDVVTLGAALNGSKKYTDQVAQSLMGGVHYRGSVSYYADLPNNPQEGDSYTVKYAGTSGSVEDGTEYTWGYDTDTSGYAWISFSKDAYSKAETDTLLGGKQATIDSSHKLSSDLVDDSSATNKFNAQADWNQTTTTSGDYIKNKPTLGTAAALDVATSGNASTSQVVKGDDTRLADSRNAADVYSWAKEANKPSYIGSEITLTGYAEAQSKASVAATDTANAAIGKLEYRVETNETNISLIQQTIGDINSVLEEVL